MKEFTYNIFTYIHILALSQNKHYYTYIFPKLQIKSCVLICDQSRAIVMFVRPGHQEEEKGKIFPTFTRAMSCRMALTLTQHTGEAKLTHSPTFNQQLWRLHIAWRKCLITWRYRAFINYTPQLLLHISLKCWLHSWTKMSQKNYVAKNIRSDS